MTKTKAQAKTEKMAFQFDECIMFNLLDTGRDKEFAVAWKLGPKLDFELHYEVVTNEQFRDALKWFCKRFLKICAGAEKGNYIIKNGEPTECHLRRVK
jgi:hypothetical protein